jgi:hypothetical protein
MLLRLGGALAAGAVVVAAAGCASGSSSSTAASTAPAATASSSVASPAAAASSSAPAVASSSAPAAPSGAGSTSPGSTGPASTGTAPAGGTSDGCASSDLQVKAGTAEGAAGSVYQTLDFTNTSGAPCTLYGYPGVSLAAGQPAAQVGAAASRSTTAGPAVVTLKPGATGNALLRITQALNYPSASCAPKTTSYLRVYPPGETTSILVSYKSMGCAKTTVKLLTIGVVQPGATASQ